MIRKIANHCSAAKLCQWCVYGLLVSYIYDSYLRINSEWIRCLLYTTLYPMVALILRLLLMKNAFILIRNQWLFPHSCGHPLMSGSDISLAHLTA